MISRAIPMQGPSADLMCNRPRLVIDSYSPAAIADDLFTSLRFLSCHVIIYGLFSPSEVAELDCY